MDIVITITVSLLAGLALGGYFTRLKRTRNKDMAWNEARCFYRLNNPFNRDEDMLFTQRDLERPITRAKRNPEDLK